MRASLAVLLAGALVLAGCAGLPDSGNTPGDDDGTPGEPHGNGPPEPPVEPATPWWRNATGETLREPRSEPCPTGPERCLEEPGLIVFRDADAFQDFRKRHLDGANRTVHFEHEVALVGIGGWQPNLCPTLRMREPRPHGNHSVVPLVLLDIQAFCPQAIGYPVTVDTVEDSRGPFKWTYRTVLAYQTSRGLWNFSDPALNPFEPRELFSLSGASVHIAPDVAAPNSTVNVTVENTGGSPLLLAGPACGFRLARNAPDTWEVYARAPGSLQDRTRVPVNATCTATVDLTQLVRSGPGGTAEGPAPGTYRVALLGWEVEDSRRSRDILVTDLTVERTG